MMFPPGFVIVRAENPYALWTPPTAGGTQFRREKWLMFVDDHGQCADRDQGRPFVASVMVPTDDEGLMHGLVGRLRAAHPDPKGNVKAASLTADERRDVADMIRDRRWLMCFYGLEPAPGRLADARAMHELLANEFRDARRRVRNADAFRRRLDFVENQLRSIADGRTKTASFASVLWMNFRHLAQWFRKDGAAPQVNAWLDERLGSNALARFLLRVTFFTTFPEIYANDLGSLLGCSRNQDFTCRLAADGQGSPRKHVERFVDGIVLADIVAYYSGVQQRGICGDPGVPSDQFQAACEFMDRAHSRIWLPFEPWPAP